MKYIIDEDKLYDLVDAEVSFAADGAYDKNGAPLFDGIVLTSKDGDMVKRLMHDAASRLVGRMSDIAKFSADQEEKKSEPTRRLLATKPVLRAAAKESIIITNPDWVSGLAAMSVKGGSVTVPSSAGSVLIGYNNRYGHYLTFYSDNPDWLAVTLDELDGQTCFRVSFTENTTGENREGMFHMFLNARLPDGRKGNEFLGIYVTIIQSATDGAVATFGQIDDSDLLPDEDYYNSGYEGRVKNLHSALKSDGADIYVEYTGAVKLLPITFSDGSSFADRVAAGDVSIELDYSSEEFCFVAPTEEGLEITCKETDLQNGIYTPTGAPNNHYEDPKFRTRTGNIIIRNVLNAGIYKLYISQRGIPLSVSHVDPFAVPFVIKQKTQIEFDAAGGTEIELLSCSTGDFTITEDDPSGYPDWLTVVVDSAAKTITYTCQPNDTGETRKFWVECTAHKVGSNETAPIGTFIEQPSSFEMLDLGISSDPQEIYFAGEFDQAHPEGHVVKPIIPNGYGFKFDVHGDFFRPSYYYGQIDVYLKSANETGAVKHGTIEIYLTSQTTGERIPGIESFFVDVYQSVKQEETTSTDGSEQSSQTEDLMLSCKPGPSNGEFEFGANGGDKAFDKFCWTGGNITEVAYERTPSWFTLRKDNKYINTDTGDSKTHYNPFGYYIHCEKNETGVERRSYVEVTIKGSGISPETSEIYVNQAAAEITPSPADPDPEHPVPVITCADTLNVPASGYEGIMADARVHVFLPIALENTDDYEVSVVAAGNIISKVNKYDDGISVWCNENDDNARTASIKITARNGYSSTEKTVIVRQASRSDQQPAPELYVKIDRHDVTIKSNHPNYEIIRVDTNVSPINIEINNNYGGDSGGDEWCQDTDVIDNRYNFEFYDMFDSGTGRTAKVDFVYDDGDEIVRQDAVLFHQPAKPKITLAKDSEDNFTWAGGKIEVPISLVGLQFADIYIKEKGIWVDPAIDAAGRKLIVSVTQNTSNAERGHIIVLEGTNELGETATATFTINQGKPPVYTGGDSEEEGEGDETTGTGKDAIEFDVPDFDLNELVGTAYNKEGVFRTISRYFVLFSCMKIFQERYPELVQVYTERAQSAMDDINNIIRQRKRPKR